MKILTDYVAINKNTNFIKRSLWILNFLYFINTIYIFGE
jgi:preprotein translocase subunit SecG